MAHNVALTDVRISKYNPPPRILSFDDVNRGFNGWCELVGNHDGNLDNIQPVSSDMRPAQLSTCTFFDIDTHGAMNGTYSRICTTVCLVR